MVDRRDVLMPVEEVVEVLALDVYSIGAGYVCGWPALVEVAKFDDGVFLPLVYGLGCCDVVADGDYRWDEMDENKRRRMTEAVRRGLPPLVATTVALMMDEPLDEWPERDGQTTLGAYGLPGTGKSLLCRHLAEKDMLVYDFDQFAKVGLKDYLAMGSDVLDADKLLAMGKSARKSGGMSLEPTARSLKEILVEVANYYKKFTSPVLLFDLPGRGMRGADLFDVLASWSISCVALDDVVGMGGERVLEAYMSNLPRAIGLALINSELNDEAFRQAVMSWE